MRSDCTLKCLKQSIIALAFQNHDGNVVHPNAPHQRGLVNLRITGTPETFYRIINN